MIKQDTVFRHPILVCLAEVQAFTFYLTGSRFFGGNKPNSDWDFFVSDDSVLSDTGTYEDSDLHLWLTHVGFKLTVDPEACELYLEDPSIVRLYEYQESGFPSQCVVHVQVIEANMINHKRRVQNILASKPMFTQLTRATRAMIWQCMMAM